MLRTLHCLAMLRQAWAGSTNAFGLNGSFPEPVFQKTVDHSQLPDLGVKLFNLTIYITGSVSSLAVKHTIKTFNNLFLPLADLIGVNLIMGGKEGDLREATCARLYML